MGCRSRGADDLHIILDFGSQPIANALLSEEKLRHPEAKFTPAGAILSCIRSIAADRDSPNGGP